MSIFSLQYFTRHSKSILLLVLVVNTSACKKLIDVNISKAVVTKELVFNDDVTANSAMTGVYANMLEAANFASGSLNSVTGICAISGGDVNVYPNDADLKAFDNYSISPDNPYLNPLWNSLYYSIYCANSILSGLESSEKVSEAVKAQLKGESLFTRAFCHFYLVNLFGEVPVVTTTDYETNAKVSRMPVDIVYKQIITDLKDAQNLLSDEYTTIERIRPNKQAVNSLLARCYLYLKDWANAESLASTVIDDSRYQLSTNPDGAFLNTSQEAIWQLKPTGLTFNTLEGRLFILTAPPTSFSRPFALDTTLVQYFDVSDARLSSWVKLISDGTTTFHFPYKYKIRTGGTNSTPPVALTEYSMILRVAEQRLIRAEARANQNELADAIADIDIIRDRANLPLIADINPAASKEALLLIIQSERRKEFFCEWGHRWFDLRRWGKANDEFGGESGWETTDQLYPIPRLEFDRNPFLGDQNLGY